MRKRGNRSGGWFSRLASSAGWPKYAFVLVDGAIIIGIALLLMAIFLVVAILMQSGKDKRLSGTIAGGAETFFGKEKASTMD